MPNTLRRITLDLRFERRHRRRKLLFETPITSFTRIDERFLTLPYRYIYVQYADSRFDSGDRLGRTDGNCIGRFDLRTSTLKPFFPGRGRAVHEPVFIPRSATSAEGDGYLLAAGDNLEQSVTELTSSMRGAMEELARVTLPFRTSPRCTAPGRTPDKLPLQ